MGFIMQILFKNSCKRATYVDISRLDYFDSHEERFTDITSCIDVAAACIDFAAPFIEVAASCSTGVKLDILLEWNP